MTDVAVTIRPVEDDDLPILYQHQADPIANDMAVVPAKDRPDFDAHWARIRANETGISRAIVADGVVVGMLVCWLADEARWVGYWVGRDHWGRGYASQGLARLLDEVPDRPLMASVADANIGSRRVLEHNGFRRIGVEDLDGVAGSLYRLD